MYDDWIRNVEQRSVERDKALEKRISALEKLVINSQNGKEILTEINEILINKNDLELIEILESIKE